jgi:anti-anti-sigma factor
VGTRGVCVVRYRPGGFGGVVVRSSLPCDPAMRTPAKVTVAQPARATVARVEGDLDLVSLPQIEQELRAVAERSTGGDLLAVDMTDVTYVNSAAIRLLYDLAEDLHSRRRDLRLVMSPRAPLRALFRRLRFDTVIPLHDTVEDAIAEAGLAATEVPGSGDRPAASIRP